MIKAFLAKILFGALALLGIATPQPNTQLGYSVATGFQKTLSASINSTQSFIPVSSLTLKDGTTLSISALGGVVFLNIEPGGNKEEIVMCTGINASSIQFTGCTRGLAFSGTSTAAVSANQKSHNAGSTIVMSNVHYVYEQFVDVNNKPQTIQGDRNATGTWTFSGGTVNFTSSSFAIRQSGGMLQWTTDGFLNSYNFSSSSISTLSASTTAGINITNSQIAVIVSTSQGMTFGIDGGLYQLASTTTGLANTSTGIYIVTSTLVSLIATTAPTPNFIPRATANGTIPVTWIATSTTSTRGFVRSTSTGAYYSDLVTSIINTSSLTRAYAVSYRNDSGRTKFITVMSDVSGSTVVNAFVSSTAGVGVRVGTVSSNDASSSILPMSFMVPPDWTYSVSIITGAAGQLSGWVEYEL